MNKCKIAVLGLGCIGFYDGYQVKKSFLKYKNKELDNDKKIICLKNGFAISILYIFFFPIVLIDKIYDYKENKK